MLRFDNGVLVAPTGFGKTVMAACLIAERKTNTVILVHRKSLLDQWRERLALFLGMPIGEIGTFSGEKKKPGGNVDVALIQSLCRKGEVNDVIANYGQLIVDGGAVNVQPFMAAIDNAIEERGEVSYYEAAAYASGIDDAIDSIEDLLKDGHGTEAVEVVEHAFRAVEEAIERVDDSDGHFGSIL